MKARHRRLLLIGAGLGILVLASAMVLNAFRSNMVFFYTPTQVSNGEVPHGASFRIGGLVQPSSLVRAEDGLTVHFVVTDTARQTAVSYQGVLPDLFKEGKGVVAEGRLAKDGTFIASNVLAKHDENYMPPEAAEALKRAQPAADRVSLNKAYP